MHLFKIDINNQSFSVLSNLSWQQVCAKKKKWDRLIIFYHGFPDTKESFIELIRKFDVAIPNALLIAPAMRGYETSTISKKNDYRLNTLSLDVYNLIEILVPNNDVPVHILGHDWGALLAFKVASLYPDKVSSIVGLAIPYLTNFALWEYVWYVPMQIYLSSYFITMQIPFLYRRKFAPDSNYLKSLWKYWSPDWDFTEIDLKPTKDALAEPSVLDATTGYYRCNANLRNLDQINSPIDFDKVPTLLIGGANDGCMHKGLFTLEQIKLSRVKNVLVKIIPRVGHWLHRENPDEVVSMASDWFINHT